LRVACSCSLRAALLSRLLRGPRRASAAVVAACSQPPPPTRSPHAPPLWTARGVVSVTPPARRRDRDCWRAFASSAPTAEDTKPLLPLTPTRYDMVYETVTLTDEERELFKLLYVRFAASTHHPQSPTQAQFTPAGPVYRPPTHSSTFHLTVSGVVLHKSKDSGC
jgi:hypothetical protein